MSLSAAALKLLLSKGLTLEDVTELAEMIEEGRPVSKGAEATRRWRVRKASGAVGDHAVITGDDHGDVPHVGERPQVVTPSLPSLRSEELIGGGVGSAGALAIIPVDDWPPGNAEVHAKLLVAKAASPWLDPHKSGGLVTTMGRVAAWRRDGASWEFDVLPAVAGLCANRRAMISSWKFFDAAIARTISDNRAALDIPQPGQVVQLRATGPPRTIDEKSSAAWDYAEKRIAEDG